MARPHLISLVTKPDDSSKNLPNDMPRNRHLKSVRQIDNDPAHNRFVVEPPLALQREGVLDAYRYAFAKRGWALYTDELFYVEQELGLGKQNRLLMTQGRSMGITMINGIQRPVFVNRFALSEPMHVITGRIEGRDLKTVLDATTPGLKDAILSIGQYEFVWYHRGSRKWAVVSLDKITPGKSPEKKGKSEANTNAKGTLAREH